MTYNGAFVDQEIATLFEIAQRHVDIDHHWLTIGRGVTAGLILFYSRHSTRLGQRPCWGGFLYWLERSGIVRNGRCPAAVVLGLGQAVAEAQSHGYPFRIVAENWADLWPRQPGNASRLSRLS